MSKLLSKLTRVGRKNTYPYVEESATGCYYLVTEVDALVESQAASIDGLLEAAEQVLVQRDLLVTALEKIDPSLICHVGTGWSSSGQERLLVNRAYEPDVYKVLMDVRNRQEWRTLHGTPFPGDKDAKALREAVKAYREGV